jgi:hypothetical protein
VQRQEAPAGVADDPGGVVRSSDDPDRRRERLVGHGVDLDRIGRRDRLLEDVDRLVHVPAV